jgi:hypothetical protein
MKTDLFNKLTLNEKISYFLLTFSHEKGLLSFLKNVLLLQVSQVECQPAKEPSSKFCLIYILMS